MEVKRVGNIYGFTGGSYAGAVYDPEGISPSIDTMTGGNRQPMIVKPLNDEDGVCRTIKSQYQKNTTTNFDRGGTFGASAVIVAQRGRNPDNPSDRRGGVPLEQRLEPHQGGICGSLTTMYKDNMVLETVKIKQNTKKGYAECELGGVADLSYPDSTTRRGRVQGDGQISPALTITDLGGINRIEKVGQISNDGSQYGTVLSDKGLSATLQAGTHGYANNCIASKYRIRKLTPLECWRLMGFTDEEFKAAEAVNSNTQLYKQAGNSIVVDVLVGIFRNILKSLEVEDMEEREFKCTAIRTDLMIDLVKFREEEPELFEELAKDYPAEGTKYFIAVEA